MNKSTFELGTDAFMHTEQCSARARGREKTRPRNQHPVLITNISYKCTLCSDGKKVPPEVTLTAELFVPFSAFSAGFSKVME